MPISPHGGVLINRIVVGEEREKILDKAESLERIHLSAREISDLDMIAVGALSPLEGFMCREDYNMVLDLKRLGNGLPWTIPITLSVTREEAAQYKAGNDIALCENDKIVAVLHLEEKWECDKQKEAQAVFLTIDKAHPGVQYLDASGEILLGGKITVINRPAPGPFKDYQLDPIETRILFKKKGWKRIVAFQTRNPIHRAHEYIQKCALEMVDGLLLHPLMGETKSDDIPADVRMKCYQILLADYYPHDRVTLSIFPAAMRYAGPREAIFHALVRKNYGCTHFIVGRDHAGVGKYYGTYDAHYIFNDFDPEEIGITPMFFDHAFFCKRCDGMATTKTCPHGAADRVMLSGTAVREMLREGKVPPKEFTRPETAEVLIESVRKMEIGMGL
ncbi:MAG: sulfate adenylyltransferase [Candidatus Schekmanbacteria bacterium]|nr:sulfate adenylyltransferase [Candidatus Schekmanbacteria bacterium]